MHKGDVSDRLIKEGHSMRNLPTTSELEFWTKALQLPDLEVVHVREEERTLRFTVVPTWCVGACPQCGKASDTVTQRREREGIVDLPIGVKAVELTVRQLQFHCSGCERAFTAPCPGLAEGSRATERFLERAAVLIRTGDIANAAAFFGVPETTLAKWYYEYVERQQREPGPSLKPVRRLGIDELSLKKSTGNSSPC
jgi:transposase